MAEANVDVVLKSIHDPSCVYLHQHLTTEGVKMAELVTDIPEGWTFLRQLAQKGMEDGGPGAHHDVLRPPLRSACPTCHHSWLTSPRWPRLPTPRPSTWS